MIRRNPRLQIHVAEKTVASLVPTPHPNLPRQSTQNHKTTTQKIAPEAFFSSLLKGSDTQAAAKIATLTRLKGIGENDATVLVHEIFYRDFRNRRELASWVGLTPTPWASGEVQRDQGIGGDGPAWIRAHLIQMAWRWLRHQPESLLSKWLEDRTAGAKGRIRKVMIVAVARKLLIALWRFSESGLVPSGAKLA